VDEFFKINQEQFEDGMILNMGQILSIPFVLTGIVILILNTGKKTRLI
jgi:prolipoprotein diacylglyceryltransferase